MSEPQPDSVWSGMMLRILKRVAVVWFFAAALPLVAISRADAAEPLAVEAVINAPIDTIWSLFTTAEGYELMGATQADVDLRIGGRIRWHDDPHGALGDARGSEREILAYDPQHLLASRPVQLPGAMTESDVLLGTWNVVYFNSIAGATTHVRVVLLGYGDDAPSQTAQKADAQRIRAALDQLVKRFRPTCAHCERPQ